MTSLIVDFAKEKEEGYQRIFARSPLLSSVSNQWPGILVAYDYFLPCQMPEVCSKQHGIAIFLDIPKPARVRRMIDAHWQYERVAQGDVVIVPADTWTQTTAEGAGGAIILGLETQEFAHMINETVEKEGIRLIPHFAQSDPLVHQLGIALKRALENSENADRLYAESVTNALMVHLLRYYCAEPLVLPIYKGGLSKLKLQRVIDYIQVNLEGDLSLKELASIAQMSAHYFSQLFKQSTGVSPHQYVIRCRVERAKELLRQEKLTIAAVAKAVGFVDQSHFHRHFKRLVGVTPKTFLGQIKS